MMTDKKLELKLSNGQTDGFFDALRDAVKNRDLDLLQGGLQDIVMMAHDIGVIDETEALCFESFLKIAHAQVQCLMQNYPKQETR